MNPARRRTRRLLTGFVLLVALVALDSTPHARPPLHPLPPDVEEALAAVLACERPDGGWLYVCERGGRVYGATKVVNLAERIAAPLGLADWDLVVLRSPGTSAAVELLIDAYDRSGREELLARARRSGDLLIALQLPNGGWFSEMPANGTRLAPWFRAIAPWATLDDDVTSGAARVLLKLWQRTGDARYRAAAERSLDLLLASQLANGAWPLTWRPRLRRWLSPSFEDLPSLNDAATSAVIETLIFAAAALDRPELLAAAQRGGDWLIEVQSPAPYPAWAQQYSKAGEPIEGRFFEPVALAAWETRHALSALEALAAATGDPRYCEPLRRTLTWLEGAQLAAGCWARFYSFEDGKPIYLDRDGRRIEDPRRARRPYRWTGDFGIPYLQQRLGLLEVPPEERTTRAPYRPHGDSGVCPGEYRWEFPRVSAPNPRVRIGILATRLTALDEPSRAFCARFLNADLGLSDLSSGG